MTGEYKVTCHSTCDCVREKRCSLISNITCAAADHLMIITGCWYQSIRTMQKLVRLHQLVRCRLAPNMIIHTNYQEIKIQENAKALAVGTVPRSICVLLQDDLADMCQTGGT